MPNTPLFQLKDKYFINAEGKDFPFLKLDPSTTSQEWEDKQNAALDEYIGEVEQADPQIEEIYKALENYLTKNLFGKSGMKILDIGCGINIEYPKYAKFLESTTTACGHVYVGLDPINYKSNERKYPFICGRIEDLSSALNTRFDRILLASSLDHFENIESVANTIRNITTDQAELIVWIGLHDTAIVSEQSGAQWYPDLFRKLQILPFLFKLIQFNLKALQHFFNFKKRANKLATNKPLDKFHFHYFTTESIQQTLNQFGEITNSLKVPGTNSMFYTVMLNQKP